MDLDFIHSLGGRYRDSRSKFILCSPQAVAWLPLAADRERWEWKPGSLLRLFYLLVFICFTLWASFVVKLSPPCLLFYSCSCFFPLSSHWNCAFGLCPAALSTGISGEIVNEDLQVSLIGWGLTLIKLLRPKGSWYIMSHGLCWLVQEVSTQLSSQGLLGGHWSWSICGKHFSLCLSYY